MSEKTDTFLRFVFCMCVAFLIAHPLVEAVPGNVLINSLGGPGWMIGGLAFAIFIKWDLDWSGRDTS